MVRVFCKRAYAYEAYEDETPSTLTAEEISELRPETVVNSTTVYEELPILTKFESYRETQRIAAYVLRFIATCRLRVSKLEEAAKRIIQAVQRHELMDEIERVQSGEPCKRSGNLNHFLDDGLLRVGGRIRYTNLPYQAKHQWIVPNKHHVTRA